LLTSGARYESFKMTSFSEYTQAGSTIVPARIIMKMTGLFWAKSIGLRYTALPRTSIYADIELEPEPAAEYEYRTDNGAFRAQVNSDKDFKKDVYTLGINTRPVSLYLFPAVIGIQIKITITPIMGPRAFSVIIPV